MSALIDRRSFLYALAGAAAFCHSVAKADASAAARTSIGAIRWDAWYDAADGNVAQVVEKSLGPAEFHHRMPFFGQETGPDSVRINGATQEILDREIGFAAQAGIDYWAFCTYAPEDPLSRALSLYLSSTRRKEIGFCLIAELLSQIPYFAARTDYLLRLMLEPGYAKVLDNRPLFYFLSANDADIARRGGLSKIADWIKHARAEMQRQGQGNPYFVLSEGNPARAQKLCQALDIDAVGLYATALGPFGGAPYRVLVENTEKEWDKLAATGLPLIPNIMTGWDTRPRLRSPTPWDKSVAPPPQNHYYQPGTPEEISAHVADALRWIAAHPAAAPANTALIYAWDECDEGFGALVPSYVANQPDGDTSRLDALAKVLHENR